MIKVLYGRPVRSLCIGARLKHLFMAVNAIFVPLPYRFQVSLGQPVDVIQFQPSDLD